LAQAEQAALDVAPDALRKVPGAHRVHTVEAADVEYDPAGHELHTDAAGGDDDPVAQAAQTVWDALAA